MRKLLLSVLAATAATCVAVPASAQYYHRPPAPTPVAMQDMRARVQDIRAHVRDLASRGIIGERQARRFEYDASRIDREIWGKSRHGLSWGDRRSINDRIADLRQRVDRAAQRGRYYRHRY